MPTKAVITDRRITLEHLRAFCAVADSGGFNAAGLKLHRSQPSITLQIKKLEGLLNCQLFQRSHGHLAGLTAEGERLLPETRVILSRLDNLVSGLMRPELKGHISFGVPPQIRNAELQTAISGCMAMNKGLRIFLSAGQSGNLAESVEQGHLDVAIVCQLVGEDTSTKNRLAVLLEEPLVWVCGKSDTISLEEEIPLVCFSEGCPWRKASIAALQAAGLRYYHPYVSSSHESVCSAIAAGFGITAMAKSCIDTQAHRILGKKARLPELPHVQTVLLAKRNSETVRQFCDLIREIPMFSQGLGER